MKYKSELDQISAIFPLGEEFDYRAISRIASLKTLEAMNSCNLLGVRYELTGAYTELPLFWRVK